MFKSLFRRGISDCPPIAKVETPEVLSRVNGAIDDVVRAISLAKEKHQEVLDKNELLEALIYAAGGYVWLKDQKGLYKWCDHKFCEDFFGLFSRDCDVRGHDDVELINSFRERTGLRHSFGELCLSTDQHCLEQGEQCRYIEAGYIGDKLFILDVLKTPMYYNDKLRGVVGFAWNRSDDCEPLIRQLSCLMKRGYAQRLLPVDHPDGADVGVWWVKPSETTCELDQLLKAGV